VTVSRGVSLLAAGILAAADPAAGQEQPLRVFSEFSRIGPDGHVVAADRGSGQPREILSPALPRNAFSSFQVVIQLPPGTRYRLYIGQNPDDITTVTLYRPRFEKGMPVGLDRVPLPVEEKMPDGVSTVVYWMDLFVSGSTLAQRAKVEPQLGLSDRWVTYPMEIRVVEAKAPPYQPAKLSLDGAAPADTAGLRNLHSLLCGVSLPAGTPVRTPVSVAQLLERNAAQDRSLAGEDAKQTLWMRTGAADRQKWCKAPARPAGASAEWYLRVRDYLLQAK
jgi:hypothetical protein